MRTTVLLVVSLFIVGVSTAAADTVDEYVRTHLPTTRIPGVSLAIVQHGRIVKAAGYGKASLELDAPATADTVYEIGSISKQIAANALLLLRDEGKLALDDPIARYIDGTPVSWAPITVRHVLTHTAGLADFDTGDIGFSYRREYVVPARADGYYWKDGRYEHGEPLRPQVIAANGGVMMNVVDFATWDIAVSQGRLLKPATVQEMATPVRLTDGTTVSHGLGWFMDTFNGHRFGAHWGTTVAGHSAVIRRYDEGVTVIVLGNLNDDGLAVDAISKHIADIYLPGTALAGLKPLPDTHTAETAKLKTALAAVASGSDAPGVVNGLGQRLPAVARERLASALSPSVRLEFLGDERLTPYHFNTEPAVVRVRRYRATTREWTRYLTIRLAADGTVRGVLVEQP